MKNYGQGTQKIKKYVVVAIALLMNTTLVEASVNKMGYRKSHGNIDIISSNSVKQTFSKKEAVSELYIENVNSKALDIVIQPSQGPKEVDAWGERDIHSGFIMVTVPSQTVIRVPLSLPQNVKTFSVNGEINAATPCGVCPSLVKGRNYWLRFPDNLIGTACISTELIGELPKSVDNVFERPLPLPNDPCSETCYSELVQQR